jgi:pyruvate dehydrogenase E2 component (dihydrolipoamide acetyltransferase)
VGATPILMPKLGLTMTEGMLAEWKVAPGEAVRAGDVMFVVETDKISNEIEASEDGVVGELLVAAGDTVQVGAMVATLVGGRNETGGEERAPSPSQGAAPQRADGVARDRIIATPLARRMAAEARLDLALVAGSGPHGRIMADDVTAASRPASRNTRHSCGQPHTGGAVIQLTPHRKTTARRLSEAKRDIPHFYIFADADVTDLLTLREQLNAGPEQPKLTINSFLIAALARALSAIPEMNRIWATDALRELPTIDIGIAVDGPKGLVAPVLRDLGRLDLDQTAAAAAALIGRARAGKLSPQDLEGGAIAISNVGMFGATGLLPIINPGHSSILGVGAAQPVFRPDAAMRPVLRHVLHLSLSCDHRAIDGALAARFLQALCRRLENPAALLRRPSQED